MNLKIEAISDTHVQVEVDEAFGFMAVKIAAQLHVNEAITRRPLGLKAKLLRDASARLAERAAQLQAQEDAAKQP